MITKEQIKFINSLSLKRNRQQAGCFVAEGEKIIKELMRSNFKIHSVYYVNGWNYENKNSRDNYNLYEISDIELKKISLLETPNKVLAIVDIPKHKLELKNLVKGLTLILDNIQDPGNMGTIIRTADWFGIKNIICSKESVDVYNQKVVQASMGSVLRINVFYENLVELLSVIKKETELPVYGAVLTGKNILNAKLKAKGFLLLGNESKGISKELVEFIDEKILIPADNKNKAESLNVAIAASIFCYEFYRQSLTAD